MMSGAREERRLSTKEAAARLGVKPATVYAYVSRGQLTRRRGEGGSGSTFDPSEVDALAVRSRREAAQPDEVAVGRLRTGITLIEEDRLFYRGVDACALAATYAYEEVAAWLWTGTSAPGTRFTAPPPVLAAARHAVASLPRHSGSADRLRVAVIAAASADPLRFDLRTDAVVHTARGLLPALVEALPLAGGGEGELPPAPEGTGGPGLAGRLWSRLTSRTPGPEEVRVLDSALILLLDHDLAASTLAARVAASSRAHPYAVVSAGLGAMDSPLHGAASGLAHRMLTEVLERGDAAPVVADHLRAGRPVPGLGHRLYTSRDPRAQALFDALESVPGARRALAAARQVEATTATPANVDLALAALSVGTGMAAEAGETVFAVARTAGWIAHALEEYDEPPLRLRPRGTYTGPRPPQPLPHPEQGTQSAHNAP